MTIARARRTRRKKVAEPPAPPSLAEAGVRHAFTPFPQPSFSESVACKRAAHLRNAARAWGAVVKGFSAADAEAHLEKAWSSKAVARQFLDRLSPHERTALGVVKLHGGALTGRLLTIEAELRGLVEKDERRRNWALAHSHGRARKPDAVTAMIDALALVPAGRDYGWDKRFPDVFLNPALEGLVEPAMPGPWPGQVLEQPNKTFARRPEHVLEDLERAAEYLIGRRSFPVNKYGWPTKPVLEGLAKALSVPSDEPWSVRDERARRRREWREQFRHKPFSQQRLSLDEPHPLPEPEGLVAALLLQSGLVEIDPPVRRGRLLRLTWERFKELPREQVACLWLRCWLETVRWQDGIGLVPDEDDRYEPQRITPEELVPSKHTLLWSLSLLPRDGWVTLDDFLDVLRRLTRDHYGLSFCWGRFVWGPKGLWTSEKSIPKVAGEGRSRAFWMNQEGMWAANCLLVTFAWLGLIERGEVGRGKDRRLVFRRGGAGREQR